MPGGYLRTNWRNTAASLGPTVIGRAVAKGSWYGKAGAEFPNGGFVMGSINGSSDFNGQGGGVIGYFSMDAISIMNLF